MKEIEGKKRCGRAFLLIDTAQGLSAGELCVYLYNGKMYFKSACSDIAHISESVLLLVWIPGQLLML